MTCELLKAEVVVVQGTPGGIAAAIAAARRGKRCLILERTAHLGGLPANGLGATDIGRRGATGGYFDEFRSRIRGEYTRRFGADSAQVRDCDDGHKFEPSVAESVFENWLAEHADLITVLKEHQFDTNAANVRKDGDRVQAIRVTDRRSGQSLWVEGGVFIDAGYEGDLAAAAGLPFRLGREAKHEFAEPVAGVVYRRWYDPRGEEHPGTGDEKIQAFNYRLCLTRVPENRVPIPKPASYRREEYLSLIDDVKQGRWTGKISRELELEGIGRVVNLVMLPNEKTDANNQHLAFISTDLPEENQDWPTADWAWRDRFALRLREYILGLLWFSQNDPDLPEAFRNRCAEWGLARDEYTDNGHFPRQVYVREGRRIRGRHLFNATETLAFNGKDGRPRIFPDSVTSSHYALDSHATRKREPGKPHLEGFFSYSNQPYTVPYGVIVSEACPNLLFPVPVSGTHVGFSTLRMEPCWMALGQAAGTAASLQLDHHCSAARVPIDALQAELLGEGAVLIFFADMTPGEPGFSALQRSTLRGASFCLSWDALPDAPADPTLRDELAALWNLPPSFGFNATTRRDLLVELDALLP